MTTWHNKQQTSTFGRDVAFSSGIKRQTTCSNHWPPTLLFFEVRIIINHILPGSWSKKETTDNGDEEQDGKFSFGRWWWFNGSMIVKMIVAKESHTMKKMREEDKLSMEEIRD